MSAGEPSGEAHAGVIVDAARQLAMALPHVTEQDHHGIPSFRVSGKIFATVPDEDHLRIMLDEHAIRAAAYENPDVYHEFYWGKRLACLLVDLGGVTQQQLSELLTEAWLDKAPPSLSAGFNPAPSSGR
ncbi:MAG TPA: MmcQ/YjbR family DNA-binding protein [Microbacteriaceae bacterium]